MTLLFVYLFIAISFSFLCSMLEAIILSTTPTFVEIKNEEKKEYSKKLKHLKENIDKPLAAILTLNTFAHTVGAAGVGAQAQIVWGNEYLSVVSIVLTLLILFLSEIIPKTLGATYWQQLVPYATYLLIWMIYTLYPFVVVSQLLTKITGKREGERVFTRSDFRALTKIGSKTGVFNKDESHILESFVKFNRVVAKNIMTPRTVVKSVSENLTAKEFYENNKDITFSRIPIFKNNPDNVTGFILKDEVFIDVIEKNLDKQLSEHKREIPIFFENYPVHKLFRDMIESGYQIVLIIDEYGGMEGIVTMEDILETLTGFEIVDETDEYKDLQILAKKVWHDRDR